MPGTAAAAPGLRIDLPPVPEDQPDPGQSGIAHITGFSASSGMIRTEPNAMKAV